MPPLEIDETIKRNDIEMGDKDTILQVETKSEVENMPIHLDVAIAFAKRNNNDTIYSKEVENNYLER